MLGLLEGDVPGSAHTPETVLIDGDTRRAVRDALKALTPQLRQVAFLRFYEGMKLRVIAQVLGVPVGTIKYQVHQVRSHVATFLRGDDHVTP